MTTTGKVLVVSLLLASLLFFWLAASVLEARNQWDKKVQAKKDAAEKTAEEIEDLRFGTEKARSETEGFEALSEKLEQALETFLEPQSLDGFRQAVEDLIRLASQQIPEETQWEQAGERFGTAERELRASQDELEEAQDAFVEGVRELLSRDLGIEDIRLVTRQVQRASSAQQVFYHAHISDLDKNVAQMQDLVNGALEEVETLREAADLGEQQHRYRTEQRDQYLRDLADAQNEFQKELERLNQTRAEVARLQEQFNTTLASNRRLVRELKEAEIRLDAMRGVQTAVISPDGRIPKGRIEELDQASGTIRINIGRRAGIRPGVQLHVYRLGENPRYLGILQVASSDSDSAVGRMLPPYRQLPVRPGDTVSPEITR